jgi:methylenetetrahydrofolate reductase (NADPH)
MKLKEIYNQNKPVISFEIFPPKAPTKEELDKKIDELFHELRILSGFNPSFISVTYGAGGSNQETAIDIVLKVKNELKILPIPHFTCVGASRENILEYLKEIENAGIENILALRGDPPKGQNGFVKHENGFGYANELVEYIKTHTNLSIAVAGYPECHPDCASIDKDIENLKKKVDCGADVIITQLFYDNNYFFDYVKKVEAKGINIPVIPGILPITGYSQLKNTIALSGCKVPTSLMTKLNANKENKDIIQQIGLEYAVQQSKDLLKSGVKGLHFYPLNKSFAVKALLENLNINSLFV